MRSDQLKNIIEEEISKLIENDKKRTKKEKRDIKESNNTKKSIQENNSFQKLRKKIRERTRNILTEKEKNPYAICTSSIAKTAGTTERSEWSDAEKKRYDDCIESVKEKQEESEEKTEE